MGKDWQTVSGRVGAGGPWHARYPGGKIGLRAVVCATLLTVYHGSCIAAAHAPLPPNPPAWATSKLGSVTLTGVLSRWEEPTGLSMELSSASPAASWRRDVDAQTAHAPAKFSQAEATARAARLTEGLGGVHGFGGACGPRFFAS